jgi:hypothetical protein
VVFAATLAEQIVVTNQFEDHATRVGVKLAPTPRTLLEIRTHNAPLSDVAVSQRSVTLGQFDQLLKIVTTDAKSRN